MEERGVGVGVEERGVGVRGEVEAEGGLLLLPMPMTGAGWSPRCTVVCRGTPGCCRRGRRGRGRGRGRGREEEEE